MFRRSFGAIAMMAALAAGPVDAASANVCEPRFQAYDRVAASFSNDRLIAGGNVGAAADRLRDAGCLTREGDLIGLGGLERSLAGTLVGESGPAIRPVSLHVGIVPGFATEAQVRTFFGDLGYRVSSIGAATLGRRIYLGPFATEGGLAEATAVALEAGFVAPYARRFGQ